MLRTDAERAFTRRWSPTKTYAPAKVPCPALPGGDNHVGYIRNASNDAIGPEEQDYLKRHRAATADGSDVERTELSGTAQTEAHGYWTSERMEAAIPADDLAPEDAPGA